MQTCWGFHARLYPSGRQEKSSPKWPTCWHFAPYWRFLQISSWDDSDVLCSETKRSQSSESLDSSRSAGYPSKRILFLAAFLIGLALAAGIFAGKHLAGQEQPAGPLEGRAGVGIISFDYQFLPSEGGGELKLIFMPTIADERLAYEVIRLDSRGNTQSYPAKYKEGVCISYVETVNYEEVTYTLKVSDGSRFLNCPLFKVHDHNDRTYTHEELWDNP